MTMIRTSTCQLVVAFTAALIPPEISPLRFVHSFTAASLHRVARRRSLRPSLTACRSLHAQGRGLPSQEVLVSSNGNNLYTASDVSESIRRESLSAMEELTDYYSFSLTDFSDQPMLLPTDEEVSAYIDANFDAILFDCDGVLYRGTDVIPGAPEAILSLMEAGKTVLFVTNNAGSSRAELRDKLARLMRLDALSVYQMVGSAYSAARYLQVRLSEDKDDTENQSQMKKKVHVIGTEGLCDEIRNAGFEVTGGPSMDRPGMSRDELAEYPFSEHGTRGVDAVVVGLDTDFNYRKLCVANVLLQRNPNALLVATNEDAYDLVGVDARHLPGNGALIKALEHSSCRKAVCVGKPSPLMAELIANDFGLDPRRTLFVGDRLDTDIRFGKSSGMISALVLTGCTTAKKMIELGMQGRGIEEEPLPCMIFPHVGMMRV